MKLGTVLQAPDLPGAHSGLWADNIIPSPPARAVQTQSVLHREQICRQIGPAAAPFSANIRGRSLHILFQLWSSAAPLAEVEWPDGWGWEQLLCWRAGMLCPGTLKNLQRQIQGEDDP